MNHLTSLLFAAVVRIFLDTSWIPKTLAKVLLRSKIIVDQETVQVWREGNLGNEVRHGKFDIQLHDIRYRLEKDVATLRVSIILFLCLERYFGK